MRAARGLVASLICLGSCGEVEPADAYTKVQSPAVELMGPYRSYQRPADVVSKLESESITYAVLEDSRFSGSNSRPRFDIFAIELSAFDFCGQQGRLRL